MRFYPADPDISTIFNRIQDGDIDLQPDFQRGEVWQVSKQQRLIDSILRGWIVPPILVISSSGPKLQVLDGQQRLASIRDFKLGLFKIDGDIAPPSQLVSSLDGLFYDNLPLEIQKKFDRTTIRIFEVSDFSPEEPAEIFFRLNQPTPLTAAEKRNAFFGPARNQIKSCVSNFEENFSNSGILSFNNSRMAYDEVIGRLICTIEVGALNKKITASVVDDLYRRSSSIEETILHKLQSSLDLLADISKKSQGKNGYNLFKPRLSRATVHSWLLFLARLDETKDIEALASFFIRFEQTRQTTTTNLSIYNPEFSLKLDIFSIDHFTAFNDRASSRVNDASSVILRDFVLWMYWTALTKGMHGGCRDLGYSKLRHEILNKPNNLCELSENGLITISDSFSWGEGF